MSLAPSELALLKETKNRLRTWTKSLDSGGSDECSNKQPLQWENNRKKAAGSLDCAVTARRDGTEGHNVPVA